MKVKKFCLPRAQNKLRIHEIWLDEYEPELLQKPNGISKI